MQMNTNRKWVDHFLLPIVATVIAGIILLPITDWYKKLTETPLSTEPPTETPSTDGNSSSTTYPIKWFEDNVSDYSNGKIRYLSPEYGIDVILPDGCLCKKYLPASQNSQEEIELQYDSDLNIEIAIGEMPYQGFDSLEEYSSYYFEIYNQSTNFYKSFNFNKSVPYCVFSFNTDSGDEIYYELIQDINSIYCVAKFSYPTSKRGTYKEIVDDYCFYVKTRE